MKIIKSIAKKIIFWFIRLFPHYECPCCANPFFRPARGPWTELEGVVDVERYRCMDPDVLCPYCKSLPRHRILMNYFDEHPEIIKNKSILYFAYEKSARRWMNRNNISCTTADLYKKADLKLDIQDTKLQDESWDIVIANHVLEHVPDYKKALYEMQRIMKKDGIFIVSFPIDESYETVTPENPRYSELSTQEIIALYGQDDHRRLFGKDSKELLENCGFDVEVISGDKVDKKYLPIKGPCNYDVNYLFLCRKRTVHE